MIAEVATITVLLPPAKACATASTSALRRARLSSGTAWLVGSAIADIDKDSPARGFYRTQDVMATGNGAGLAVASRPGFPGGNIFS
jgi:hypothetical protein